MAPNCLIQQDGVICTRSWGMEVAVSLLSLFLWSVILAIFGSITVVRLDHANDIAFAKHRKDRLEYISKIVVVQTIPPDNTCKTKNAEKSKHGQEHPSSSKCCGRSQLEEQNIMCSICLEEFRAGDIVCQSPSCCHIFHLEGCMNQWLLEHDDCPYCRSNYLAQDNKQLRHYVQPLSTTIKQSISSSSSHQSLSSLSQHNYEDASERFLMEDFIPPLWAIAGAVY